MFGFILTLFLWFILVIIKLKKSLHMLQQNLYNKGNRYLKWIINNFKKVFLSIDIILVIFLLFLQISKNYVINTILICLLLLVSIIKYINDNLEDKKKSKKPLVYTNRIKRLIVTICILLIIPVILMVKNFNYEISSNYYTRLIILVYLIYFVSLLATIINIPIEKYVYYSFKNKAMKKLKNLNSLKVIGITGSYGKTSSKNILSDILNIKYNALPSPKNFNTPYGLIMTINNTLDKFDDIFIAEMGAYKKGEIKELCDLVNPKYGILTTIGTAHLESFGSEENIIKTKFELIESLPSDGVAVLNMDDDKQVSYNIKSKCKKIWVGINNDKADFVATNIKMNNKGMSFEVVINGEKVKFNTKLLGVPNIYNILAGIALGNYFGISNEQLKSAVLNVKNTEHRLELKNAGDITYIDDSYNSNPVGSKMALDVLNLMPGKKIIMTPGMIELGSKQYELNKELGEYIASVCDEVILVGEKQTIPIQDGLKAKNYNEKKIHITNDVKEGFKIVERLKTKNTYVLIENDLPDLFNE
ncbi:MAG: UDP-N-acetylmuramoyl-tripeptide--D-alanyl-D-alanine ligase [Firmicutes bacterium]|nr:UDP-N-acetylmuramoyl-tripeptide--D-alanyl-D-alanine ligase [Bacillota bacterium]